MMSEAQQGLFLGGTLPIVPFRETFELFHCGVAPMTSEL
jgi:hypothetical protein